MGNLEVDVRTISEVRRELRIYEDVLPLAGAVLHHSRF